MVKVLEIAPSLVGDAGSDAAVFALPEPPMTLARAEPTPVADARGSDHQVIPKPDPRGLANMPLDLGQARLLQAFRSSVGGGKPEFYFDLLERRNAQTGKYELVMISADPAGRTFPVMLVEGNRSKPAQLSEFGYGQPLLQKMRVAFNALNASENRLPAGQSGGFDLGNAWDAAVGAVGSLVHLPAALPRAVEGLLRNFWTLPGQLQATGEALVGEVTGRKPKPTGPSNLILTERREQFQSASVVDEGVAKVTASIANLLGANPKTLAYAFGNVIGPYLVVAKVSGASGRQLPRALDPAMVEKVNAGIGTAPLPQVVDAVERMSPDFIARLKIHPDTRYTVEALIGRLRGSTHPAAVRQLRRLTTAGGSSIVPVKRTATSTQSPLIQKTRRNLEPEQPNVGATTNGNTPKKTPGVKPNGTTEMPGDQQLKQVQDVTEIRAMDLFKEPGFQNLFKARVKEQYGQYVNQSALIKLLTNAVSVQEIGKKVALDAVMKQIFGGSGVPDAVRQAFQARAEAWAQQKAASKEGGTAAGWLEALATDANASGHRAELLRPVVAAHLSGGNERLKHALEAQLSPLDESALKNLTVPGRGGGPQQAAVDTLRRALVARWAEDYTLSAQDQARLGQAIGQRLQGRTLEQQRAELVNLASSDQTRNLLVEQTRGKPERVVAPVNAQVRPEGSSLNLSHRDILRPQLPTSGPDTPRLPPVEPTIVGETSSGEKMEEFSNGLGAIDGNVLPYMQRPPEPELELNAANNANAKSTHAHQLSRIPSWLQIAELAAARGVIPHDVALDLRIWYQSGGKTRLENYRNPGQPGVQSFDDENSIWQYMQSAASASGQGPALERMIDSPVYTVTDDSQLQMRLVKDGVETELSFDLLNNAVSAVRASPELARQHRDLLDFHEGIISVAAYLQAARNYRNIEAGKAEEAPYESRAKAWDFYVSKLADTGLLGPDGAPIAGLLGPEKLLRGLNSLAIYLGASIGDIHATSQSNVHATLSYRPRGWEGETTYSSQGMETYRFKPWEEIQQSIAGGGKPVHLSDVLIANPDAPANQQITVSELIENPIGTSAITARQKALAELRQKMMASGIAAPAASASFVKRLRPLDQADTVRIVIPDQINEQEREKILDRVSSALKDADRKNDPRFEFVALSDVATNPDASWNLLGSTAVFLIDPSSTERLSKEDAAKSVYRFVRLAMDFEINGTVGDPVHGQTPTFVIGETHLENTGAGMVHRVMRDLYILGKIKNKPKIFFSSLENLPSQVEKYWAKTPIRPADSDLPRISSPLAVAEPMPDNNQVVIALYGSAKELADPEYTSLIPQLTSAAIETFAERTPQGILREKVTFKGADLIALGKRLGVSPPSDQASERLREDYYQRLDAAIRTMPGIKCESRDSNGAVEYILHVPVMKIPVVFSHGGGVSPFDPRRADDPTTNIMGAFNSLYLARINGKSVISVVDGSNRGVTTLALEKKEGRETSPQTNERIYTDHIQQRTLETQRGANLAFAFYGGIGTAQEILYFPGLIVLIDRDDSANDILVRLRETAGLRTIMLDPADSSLENKYRMILEAAPALNPNDGQFDQRVDQLQKIIDLIGNQPQPGSPSGTYLSGPG